MVQSCWGVGRTSRVLHIRHGPLQSCYGGVVIQVKLYRGGRGVGSDAKPCGIEADAEERHDIADELECSVVVRSAHTTRSIQQEHTIHIAYAICKMDKQERVLKKREM